MWLCLSPCDLEHPDIVVDSDCCQEVPADVQEDGAALDVVKSQSLLDCASGVTDLMMIKEGKRVTRRRQ